MTFLMKGLDTPHILAKDVIAMHVFYEESKVWERLEYRNTGKKLKHRLGMDLSMIGNC